jgi:hypothetical protein
VTWRRQAQRPGPWPARTQSAAPAHCPPPPRQCDATQQQGWPTRRATQWVDTR